MPKMPQEVKDELENYMKTKKEQKMEVMSSIEFIQDFMTWEKILMRKMKWMKFKCMEIEHAISKKATSKQKVPTDLFMIKEPKPNGNLDKQE